MKEQQGLRHHEFGKAEAVLRLESIPVVEPEAGEVRVRLLAAAINPSDYGRIDGRYGHLPELPALGGREGVGVVESLGAGVVGVECGQRVRFCDSGAWQELACLSADQLMPVPDGVPTEQAAIAFINPPTAYCLLRQFVSLERGDWIVQNAGNSAVGLAVIQMAKALGVHTLSQVRRVELVEPLTALGADQVVLEGSGWERSVGDLTGGRGLRLALNSVGGGSAIAQLKALADGGTQVTFGGMTGEAVRFPTRYLIFNDVRLAGFWWDRYCRKAGREAVEKIMEAVFKMQADGSLCLPIAGKYSFSEFKEALAQDQSPRLGKILLVP
jgi:NADPH:quinone reductase-like Zn-dependent oxidoreductase